MCLVGLSSGFEFLVVWGPSLGAKIRSASHRKPILETIGYTGLEKNAEGRLFVRMNKGKLWEVMGAKCDTARAVFRMGLVCGKI